MLRLLLKNRRGEQTLNKIKPKQLEHKPQTKSATYIPAFSLSFLTPFYDFMMKLGARESTFKPKLVEKARIKKGYRVLDLGCGTGTLTVLLKKAQLEAEVIGLDGDPKVLEIAKSKVAKAGLNILLDYGMAFELPYFDNSFDRVVSSMVFHHLTIENKARTLKEAFRVLKPSGEIHLADFGKPQNGLMHLSSLIVRHLEETADLIKGSLPDILQDAGFENVEQTGQFMTVFGTFAMYKAQKPAKVSEKVTNFEIKIGGASTENQSNTAMVEKREYYSSLRVFFRILAPFYDAAFRSLTFGSDSKLRDEIVRIVNAPTGSRILDVATGTGKQAFAFAKKGYDVVGIDLSEYMLKKAKNNNKQKNLRFDIADAANLPFEDNSFDVSSVSFALHDMIPTVREKALKEMVRVTKSKGTVVIVDYALPRDKMRRFFFHNFIRLYEPYYREFIKSDLESLLEKSGIEIGEEHHVLLGAGRILKGTKIGGD